MKIKLNHLTLSAIEDVIEFYKKNSEKLLHLERGIVIPDYDYYRGYHQGIIDTLSNVKELLEIPSADCDDRTHMSSI